MTYLQLAQAARVGLIAMVVAFCLGTLAGCGGGGDDGEYQEHDKPLDPPACSIPGHCG